MFTNSRFPNALPSIARLTFKFAPYRWDSSDPERAPPPLPLNPGSASGPATRPNTSARIEEAAALITARARENAPSSYITNPAPSASPEKSLIKPHHKRMQSIQSSSSVRSLSDSLERRSPEKGLRTSKLSEYEELQNRSPERSPTRSGTETPTPSGRETPSHLNKPILGENTPPSATMLALQNMRSRAESETPLTNVTNNASSLVRTPQTFDAISSQILSLTSIATNLQREMAQLSRRSKDNATDLISLKEATNTRDEDIRKSLKDLIKGLEGNFSSLREATSSPNFARYLDNRAQSSSPGGKKTFSLPRIPSPTSFSAVIDRELTASPSIVSADGAASIALLEKILREMGTKDGQDKIQKTLEDVKSQSLNGETNVDPAIMKKLEEILSLTKDRANSRALIRASGNGDGNVPPPLDFYFDQDPRYGPLTKMSRGEATPTTDPKKVEQKSPANEFVNDEIMKMLKRVKQSISESGGLTNEVKALVRELRGEVLGMGREIARKLEQAESTQKALSEEARGPCREEIAEIVESGLGELKQHMYELIRENRRQSAASTRPAVDTQEVVLAVRNALADLPKPDEASIRNPEMEREQLLVAIKEAWEDCKPEIALEHFGLERDEILETLKEGLRSYEPQHTRVSEPGITYDDVLDAVQKGMANFQAPTVDTEASITREEILVTVRECLESFEFPRPEPAPSTNRDGDLTRDDVLEAVREGLTDQPLVTKEIEFNRDDLLAAVKASLEGTRNPMYEFLDSMKTEFKQYSAANGKDTEQVLDALKDGLEELRADIETYVDRAADVTGKDEIIDTVKSGIRALQADLDKGFANRDSTRGAVDTPELLDAMEKEFEHLRDSISKSLARNDSSLDKEEILDAIRDIADSDRRSGLSSNSEDIVRLVKEELEHMRTTLAGTLIRSGSSIDREEVLEAIREGLDSNHSPRRPEGNESILSNTSELLDAFQDGVDGIRADMKKLMDRPVDLSTSYEILDTLKAGLENVRSDIDRLYESQRDLSETATARGREVVVHDENLISTEIEGLKVMITQLRIKVEALDFMPPPEPAIPSDDQHLQREDLADLYAAIKAVHHSVNNFNAAREVPLADNTAKKEDTDAIETLLRNVKAKLEDFSFPEADTLAKSEHVESLEDMIRDMKNIVEESAAQAEKHSVAKDDLTMVELLLREVAASVDELQNKVKVFDKDDDQVTKADIQAVETLCLDTKTQIDELQLPDPATITTKEDISKVHDTIKAFQEQIEAENELTAQAFEARKTEHGGLANKIEDVKVILADIRDELLGKLDGSEEGIHELAKVLESHRESMNAYATAASLSELTELVNREFERHFDHHVNTKLEFEDRDAMVLAKHDSVSEELKAKIDDRFNELMTKYDDAQIANDGKIKAIESRDDQHLDAMNSTKAVAEDLKLLIDTLGTTVTETCDRMSDDAKTVYNRVNEVNVKLNDLQNASANEHSLTRDEVAKTFAAALRLEATVTDNQPALMAAIREVLGIVGQHFEYSQQQAEQHARSAEEMKSAMDAIPSAIPPLLPALPPAPIPEPITQEIPVQKEYDDSQLHDKLDVLIGHASAEKEYDDSQVHDKLNVLISHASGAKEALAKIEAYQNTAKDSLANMEKLDKIHEQMIATAGEVSAMAATQTRLMAEHHNSKTVEAAEASIALEKRIAQKEKVEADVIALNKEKAALAKAVEALKREKEDLAGESRRLTREVAKLETALNLRQEEMRDMDARAERLERRILEGVMDHARSRNISKPSARPKVTAADRDASMSLKRVPSEASTITTKTSIRDGSSTLGSAVGMALKKRTPLGSSANSTVSARSSGIDRRILSTSHVTSNRSREVPDRALKLAPTNTGLVNLKRSHSVKSNPSSYYGGRKTSWNGTASDLSSSAADKENQLLSEEDEEENRSVGDETSDAGTERRTSFSGTRTSLSGTSSIYTDSLSYGTGSSVSTDGGRSVSYASSTGGAIGGKTESIAEEDEDEVHGEHSEITDDRTMADEYHNDQAIESGKIMALLEPTPTAVGAGENNSMALTTLAIMDDLSDLQPPPPITGEVVKYNQGSDSGLGTEPPTADETRMGSGLEYFDMTKDVTCEQ